MYSNASLLGPGASQHGMQIAGTCSYWQLFTLRVHVAHHHVACMHQTYYTGSS